MTAIFVRPDDRLAENPCYRASAGDKQSVGNTIGEAIDALTPQLSEEESTSLIIVQSLKPDRFFTDAQQQRMEELMTQWRTARDTGAHLPTDEQTELEQLVDAELKGATLRAEALMREAGQ